MNKIKKLLGLAIKGILYIYTPVIILLFLIYSFFLTMTRVNLAYRFIIYGIYMALVGFSYALNYSPKTTKKNAKNFTHLKRSIAKGKWDILEESKNTLRVKPQFDFPFRLLIKDRVQIEYKDQRVNIRGPRYYVDNILKDIEGKASIWARSTNTIFSLVLIILLVSIPVSQDLKLSWQVKEKRHKSFVENVQVLEINSPTSLGNSVQNINNHGQGVENKEHIFYVEEGLNLVKTNKDFEDKSYLIQKTSGSSISRLNLAGDWLFYASGETINRIRLDGSDNETIYQAGHALDLHLKDNWLYFINFWDNSNIYKMDINGRNLQRFLQVDASDIAIYDKTMIFSYHDDSGSYVESINLDGSERKLEFEANSNKLVRWNDSYYFIGKDYKLYQKKVDEAREPQVIVEGKVSSYLITDAGIFYSLHSDEVGYPGENLYKVELDGSNNSLILEALEVEGLTKVADSVLFNFWDDNHQWKLHRLDIQTNKIEAME